MNSSKEYNRLNEKEREETKSLIIAIRNSLVPYSAENISIRSLLVAFLVCLESTFEVLQYTKKDVQMALQNIINNYSDEMAYGEES